MKTKRFIILGFMAALITSVMGSLLLPTLAQAATSATWVDQATIDINGVKYKEDDASDSNWHFSGINPDGGCPQELKGFTNPGYDTLKGPYKTQTVKLHKQKAVAGGCTSDGVEDIQLQANPPGYNVAFVWTDNKNIESADGRKKFSQDAAGNFVSITDSGACKDFIVVGGDKSQLNLTIRANKGGFGPAELILKYSDNGSSGYPFAKSIRPAGEVKINGQDCYESNSVGVAANAANSTREGTSSAPGASGAGGNDNSCESKDVMGWVSCPIIMSLDGIFNWIDTQIQALLDVNEKSYKNDELYSAWSNIRNIAYIVLIPVMLVMVIGTALGSELFSAYTIKKAIPRMIAATLFISLSWYICMFFISFFNVLGSGMLGLITSPFGLDGKITLGSLFNPSAGGAVTQVVGGGTLALGVFAIATINGLLGIMLLYFATAVLVIFIAFLILVIRQMFILALVLAAPLAILAWIFPGNDKMWKWWWGTFSKLLIMFPLITGLIAVGRVFAYLVGNTPTGGVQGGLLNPLLKITAYIIPYVLIPMTFKFAGGAFATLAGMANDRGKGVFDRLKKGRQKGWQKIGHNAKDGNLFRGKTGGKLDNLNKTVQAATLMPKAGFRPDRWRGSIEAQKRKVIEAEREEMQKKEASVLLYDNLAKALFEGEDHAGIVKSLENQEKERWNNKYNDVYKERKAAGDSDADADAEATKQADRGLRYVGERGARALAADAAAVEDMRKNYSTEAFKLQAVLSMEKGGTAEKSGGRSLQMLVEALEGSEGGDAMQAIAQWREAAMAGGQVTHGGGSQGDVFAVYQDLVHGRIKNLDEADKRLRAAAVKQQGAGVLTHQQMKSHDVDSVMDELEVRIKAAVASGDVEAIDREMALVNNVHYAASQTNPQNAEKVAKRIMQMEIDTKQFSDKQRSEEDGGLGHLLVDQQEQVIVVEPARTETRVARDDTGKVRYEGGQPVMETINIPAVTRTEKAPAMRLKVNVRQMLEDRRKWSERYHDYTKDFGSTTEDMRRAAATPGPGAGPIPPMTPHI